MPTPHWTDELKESLMRAGPHIHGGTETMRWQAEGRQHFCFKLGMELPKGSRKFVTNYIKLFAREHGVRDVKVRHAKFSIAFSAGTSP
jgi:hypothetical protein